MAVNFALSIGNKIAEYLADPIGRQFGYVIVYKSNLGKLREEVNKLEERSGALQLSVDASRRNGRIIGPDVEGWLEMVKECSSKASEILKNETEANKGCLNGWCPNLKSRHSLGRKATKKAKEVAELHGEGNFTTVSYPAPPPGIESESTEGIKSFESRRWIINGVVQALKDDRFHMIGICGMGGVGKTTMVKQVAERVKKEKSSAMGGAGKTPMVKEVTKSANEEQMFDEVVIALVSQSPDEKKIQAEIADKLGLKFEEESVSGRADRLRESLRSKRILLILDDVWKRLELNDIGIPYGDGHGGCKILLTSRFIYVCDDMGAEKKFTVEALDKEEAWNLFKETAGISNDTSTEFYSTQKAVVDECGGLPVAIKAVARALKGKGEPSWDSALGQLQRSIIKSIRGVEDQVFKSLELSYNSLESKEAQKVFLFCSLYPEDFDIPIEDLVRYGIGLESFEGIDTVGEARQKVHDFVDDLKKCYLLMDSEEEECVKMHDVIRDVAISIASGEEHSFMVRYDKALEDWPQKHRLKNYIVISLKLNGMHGLPSNLEFPKLQLLKLDCNADLDNGMEEVQIQDTPDCFCQGMKELRVLALSNLYGSLPTSLQCLTNLRTLSLSRCQLADDDVSVIGALENLEILSFAGSCIKELPKEIIGHLGRLKVLDLLNCTVARIYPGVLSSLSMLEELYVGNSFQTMDGLQERRQMTNAIIAEVASLSHLVALDIELFIWPRDWVIDKVKRFNITVYPSSDYDVTEPNYRLPNRLELRSMDVADLRDSSSLKMLSHSTKILELDSVKGLKNIMSDLDEYSFEHLTKLTLQKCDDLEYLINTPDDEVLPVLESLELTELDNFKGIICHGQLLDFLPEVVTQSLMGPTPLKWFGNLKSIFFWKCAKMENVFSLSIARNLMHLEHIGIVDCHLMEVIVSNEGGEHEIAAVATDKIEFPKLKNLYLWGLPSFTAFCKAKNAIELPQLEYLFLSEIPKLSSLCPASAIESNYDAYIQPLFDNKVNLTSLESLYVSAMDNLIEIWPGELQVKLRLMTVRMCHGLPNILFPSNLMKAMQSLEILVVQDCQSVEVAFGIEGLIVREGHQDILFPSLIDVSLGHLPKLTHVWKDNLSGIQGFENLTSLNIKGCGSLRYVFPSSISKLLVKLQEIEVTECRVMEVIIDEEPKVDDEVATNVLMFPQLNTLKLRDLPNLGSFCLQAYTFERSLLKTVEVINCPNMKALPSAFKHMQEQQMSNVQKANFLTSTQHHLLDGKIIMGRKRKPDHSQRMMSDVLHNRTSVAPPSEEASHRPASEGPLVPPPSEGPLPPYRPPSVAPQQLPCTQPPRLPSVRPPSVAPQQLSSSAYEPSADPSTSSQPTSGHVSSSSTSTRRGRGCAKGIKEWGTGKKLDIEFDGNYCPIGANVAKLTTQLGIIVRNGNIVPLTFLDWNSVPADIVDAIWKDVKDNLNICPEEYKPICMKNCNSIWKDHKNKLKAKYFKPRSSDPNLKDDVPMNVVPSQWEQLVEYWRTSDAEKIASRNAKNRRAHDIAHTTGRTTFSQIRHEMTSKGESTDKMNVWLMTRRVDDPEVIQTLDEFNRQLSMLPEDGQTLEARNAIFHELIDHDGHGYCRTYGRIVPRRAVYKDGAGPSQSTPQPSTIDQITQKVRAELRDELKEELRAEFSTHLQQMRAEMMALVSQGASVDPNRQVPDASSGHRAFRESAKDENPYTPLLEDQIFPE